MGRNLTVLDVIREAAPFRVPVEVSQCLTGMKKAIYDGHTIFFSPAMDDLIGHDMAEHGEITADLLVSMPCLYMPNQFRGTPTIPMMEWPAAGWRSCAKSWFIKREPDAGRRAEKP
jgi:hypothetical protein